VRPKDGKVNDDSGSAKTREAKLGCVFTQTSVDEEGYPVRDRDSTTYVGAIETAEEFGQRVFTETIRRGLRFAERLIVIGDGALWIWNIAAEHFPGATEIVDLYHAREHVSHLAKMLYDPPKPRRGQRRASTSSTRETSKGSSLPCPLAP